MSGVRIDKWLWAARFFKTRALASKACELGRVQFNTQRVKPAREVRISDKLRITTDSGDFGSRFSRLAKFVVLLLLPKPFIASQSQAARPAKS